jgi:ubiquinol-cytochrome c reductase cytochrome b subunit
LPDERAVVEAKQDVPALPAPEQTDPNGVPAPAARGPLSKARTIANRAFTETIEFSDGHGDGHGNGYGNGHGEVEDSDHAAIGSQEER